MMLPSRTGLVTVLTPEMKFDVVKGDGPIHQWAATEEPDNRVARVLELHALGNSNRAIEMEIYGYAGGRAHEFVKGVLDATM